MSSSGSSRSSSSGAQRGAPMAPRGHGGGWGTRSGTLGTRGRAALPSREPGGSYKGEPRGDSRPVARGGARRGHTHPAPHAHTRTCPAPPRAQAPRGQSPPRGAASPSQPSCCFCSLRNPPPSLSCFPELHVLSPHTLGGTSFAIQMCRGVPTTCRARRTQLSCIRTHLFSMSTASAPCVPGTATVSVLRWHNLERTRHKPKTKSVVKGKNKTPRTPQLPIPCEVEGLGCPSSCGSLIYFFEMTSPGAHICS